MCVKHELPFGAVRHFAVPVWISSAGRVFVSDWSEFLVIAEIYRPPGDYDSDELPADPAVIVDVGANIGLAARFFSRRYPGARIIAYEPDPLSHRVAKRNVAHLSQVSLRNAAVAPEAGQLLLHRVAGESWRTSSLVADQPGAETFVADAVTLDSIIQDVGAIDILKIDIEGGEYDVVQASQLLDRVDFIVGELHPVPGRSAEEFFSHLGAFDILEDEVTDGKGTFLACRRRANRSGEHLQRSVEERNGSQP